MGETGKRSRHDRDRNDEGKNQKKRLVNKENSGEGELVVYRILCPDNIIGSVIGKGGKVINSLRQESRAKIKVVDAFPGADKRVITIYCYVKDKDPEDVNEDDVKPVCPAQDALLRVHYAIVSVLASNDDSDKRKEEAHLLVPASQAANIIGKSGANIKRIRAKTRANIKVSPKDPSELAHSCAMAFDNFVQITGDSEAVKNALFAVSAIMYKFSPREEISLETTVPELPPIIIPSDVPIYPAGSFYPGGDAIVPPRNLPPLVSATTQVPSLHGFVDTDGMWPMYSSALPVVSGYGGPSRSEELVVQVLCPADKIGRVIGKGGSTIKNIRQASGANIDVNDKKHGTEECIITVSSTESIEDVKSASVEAVLLLQNKISDEDDERVNMRLLVPSKVIGCLIGKNGSIINEMRKKTKADVRISKGEKPKHAAASDELVEVIGEVGNSRDAILQIILRLREHILKDKDGSHTNPPLDSRYSSSLPVSSVVPGVRQAGTLGYDHDQRAEAERGWECFQVAVYMGTILSRPETVHIISFPRILLKVTQAEIAMFDSCIVVYKFIQDLHFFVTGGDEENELILATVLQGFFDAVGLLLRNNVDKRTALENLDMILLCLDEIVDGGIILETEGSVIAGKVATSGGLDGATSLSEQTISQALATAREHLARSLLK